MDSRGDHACPHAATAMAWSIVITTSATSWHVTDFVQRDCAVIWKFPSSSLELHTDQRISWCNPPAPLPGCSPDRPHRLRYYCPQPLPRGHRISRLRNAPPVPLKPRIPPSFRPTRECYGPPLHLPSDAPLPPPEWHFVPLAFDTLGAPSSRTAAVPHRPGPAHSSPAPYVPVATAKTRASCSA